MTRKQVKRRPIKKKRGKVAVRITLLTLWLLAGLYFGIAGWANIYIDDLVRQAGQAHLEVDCSNPGGGFEYNGETYCTMQDVIVDQSVERVENLRLQWVSYLPDPLPMLLAAFAFGAVGSVVRILRMIIAAQELSSFYTLSLSPALGGMTAVMLLGLSFLLPSIFTDAKVSLNPTIVPFLSLFAGAFSEHIQKWFQIRLDKIFGIQKEKTDAT